MKLLPTVYLNGQFLPGNEAFVSAEDRGFYFADGVYEVIKYYMGIPFCQEEHFARLKNSLAGVRIAFDRFSELKDICTSLIEKNFLQSEFAGIYIQITRGVAPRTHSFPAFEVIPTLYVRAFPMPAFISEMENGVRVISREDIRWLRCNVKSIALLPNTLLFQEAVEAGAFECLLVRNGNFTEATHSNILMVRNGMVYTHPDGNLILPGITKAEVFRLCSALHVKVMEEPVRADEINKMDECFITGTGSEIMPVIKIDDHVIGNGRPGPVTRLLQSAFFKNTYEKLAGEKLEFSKHITGN